MSRGSTMRSGSSNRKRSSCSKLPPSWTGQRARSRAVKSRRCLRSCPDCSWKRRTRRWLSRRPLCWTSGAWATMRASGMFHREADRRGRITTAIGACPGEARFAWSLRAAMTTRGARRWKRRQARKCRRWPCSDWMKTRTQAWKRSTI